MTEPMSSVTPVSGSRPFKTTPGLRVDTSGLTPGSITPRARSNSAQSNLSSNVTPHASAHQFSRSLSHDPSSQGSMMARNDVALAINGLRGGFDVEEEEEIELPPGLELRSRQESFSSFSMVEEEDLEDEVSEEDTLDKIHEILRECQKRGDTGDTLDLSRKGIKRIGPQAVELFKRGVGKEMRGVWRLALSYNALKDGSFEPGFASLGRLRYLNLKGNNFTNFPAPLCDLTSLEILDLSKNKIESFPEQPGRLTQLKVLSLTNNRIYTLPSYLTKFDQLKVFKVDLNPIEWPPREVLGSLMEHESSKTVGDTPNAPNGRPKKDEDLRPWIENMKRWMRQTLTESDEMLTRKGADNETFSSEDEPQSAISLDTSVSSLLHPSNGSGQSLSPQASVQTIRPVREDSSSHLASAITNQLGQHKSGSISQDSLDSVMSPGLKPPSRLFQHDRGDSTSSSNLPPLSASSTSSSSHSRAPSSALPPTVMPSLPGHTRGASFTATQRLSATLKVKKSLPDLRQNHAKIIQERREEMPRPAATRAPVLGIDSGRSISNTSLAWGESKMSPAMPSSQPRKGLVRKTSADMLCQSRPDKSDAFVARGDSGEAAMTDESRNSYFRRMSTLPKSTISKSIPASLLRFMDATRGILFALSQLHSALRQYLAFVVNERVVGVFQRVMESASKHMDALIDALDRFDSMSRRSYTPMPAVQGVVEKAQSSVTVFGKLVTIVRLHVPVIKGGDTRYTRTLLLMIYGSMTEITLSWRQMTPLLVNAKQIEHSSGRMESQPAKLRLGGHKLLKQNSLSGRTPISPISERPEVSSPMRPRAEIESSPTTTKTADGSPHTADPTPARPRNRRLAGSFSTEDVERGMHMGSPGASRSGSSDGSMTRPRNVRHRPSESASSALENHAEESGEEQDTETLDDGPNVSMSTTSPNGTSSMVPLTPPDILTNGRPPPKISSSSRPGHQAQSSSESLPGLNLSTRKISNDLRSATPDSANLLDEDLLDVIETATDQAYIVWLKLAEDIGSVPNTSDNADHTRQDSGPISPQLHSDLLSRLSDAEHLTTNLRESLMRLRADPQSCSNTSLPDDTAAFIKIVIRVSELVKAISNSHPLPPHVRQHLSRLTQTTRECAILLQVSSLRSTSSTPALVPPASARSNGPMTHMSRGSAGNDSGEEIVMPHSASSSNWANPPPSAGLRGLQLPSRQLAMARSRSANLPYQEPELQSHGMSVSHSGLGRDNSPRRPQMGRIPV